MPSIIAAGEFKNFKRCARLAWMLESVTMALRHHTPDTSFAVDMADDPRQFPSRAER
jgi:hypothetical protein